MWLSSSNWAKTWADDIFLEGSTLVGDELSVDFESGDAKNLCYILIFFLFLSAITLYLRKIKVF